MEAMSDSFVNHKVKSTLLETATLIPEMTMKPLFLWQSTKAAFVKVVRLWAALLFSNGHRAASAWVSAVTSVRLQPPEEEQGRLATQRQILSPGEVWARHPPSPQ